MARLIWRLYSDNEITLQVAKELLITYRRKKEIFE